MAESTDYKRFKAKVPQPGDRLDRVENILVRGMPDINMCSKGTEIWMEQKSPREPKRPRTPLFGSNHRVSQNQKNWFLRQRQAGRRAWFLITTDKRWMLIDGIFADQLNEMTVNELIMCSSWSTLKPVRDRGQWAALHAVLFGH